MESISVAATVEAESRRRKKKKKMDSRNGDGGNMVGLAFFVVWKNEVGRILCHC